ncbi:alpha/beta fold hydrolase [Antrihabitans sp. YC2-6]|uniref:alpha/beta fold hydrolase n=1 Tax=Antrihabitans sp. YC2-6 TaxID=2799498 RepID=UPI0018F787B4|nr:alpha/beta hydrolase [Antrihabitans sp. YC2-6]MBJ8345072.1 alpha/beta hydrolase [Antrihabitans sp. YC2-6]
MQSSEYPVVAVVMPGTGSDADFVGRAFGAPLRARGLDVITVEPDPRRVVASYLEALDAAAAQFGPIVAGGVSLGAAVALNWAYEHSSNVAAVLAALPPWTAAAPDAPAAISARLTAHQLRSEGLEAVTAAMRAGSPDWLGAELARSWRSQWPDLPNALEEAAAYVAPTVSRMEEIGVPVGIATATDDLVHPTAVAEEWASHLRIAGIGHTTLDDIALDATALGRAALAGLDSTGYRLGIGS